MALNNMKKNGLIVLSALIIALTLQSLSFAIDYSKDDRYTLPVNDTIFDDLYIICGGSDVSFSWDSSTDNIPGGGFIDGTITGDLVVIGGRYNFSGEILGNLNTATQFARIHGIVHKSARLCAQYAVIDGPIGNDVLIFASQTEIGKSAVINNDAVIVGDEISILGEIGRDLYIRGNHVIIGGRVGGDINIEANSISIESATIIDGNISYKSPQKIAMADDVIVGGEVEWLIKEIEDPEAEGEIDWYLKSIFLLCSLVTGLFIILIFNSHTKLSVQQIRRNPLQCLGIGFIFICAFPIAFIALIITIIGIPTALVLMFAITLFFYISKIYVAILIGNIIIVAFRKGVSPKQGYSLALGLLTLSVLFTIPYLGWLIYFLAIFIGLGGLIRAIWECGQQKSL